MKRYIKPQTETVKITIEQTIMAGSMGVDTGTETSVQYAPGMNPLFDEDEN